MRTISAPLAALRLSKSFWHKVKRFDISLLRQWTALSCIAALASLELGIGSATAAAVAQAYKSSSTLTPGTLVSLDSSDPTSVVAADGSNNGNLLGVVVSPQDSVVSLSTSSSQNTLVATSGTVNTLVSDINGNIKAGDYITVSPIGGIGMLANFSAKVVGIAQSDFSASSSNTTQQQVTDKSGKTKTVTIGKIPVLLNVTFYTSDTGNQQSLIPPYIQNLVDTLAGKKVSTTRIIVASILLLMALTIVIILVYGAVRSAIISIGRNPLSAPSVRRSLFQVLLVAVVILGVAMGAIFLIITR